MIGSDLGSESKKSLGRRLTPHLIGFNIKTQKRAEVVGPNRGAPGVEPGGRHHHV